MGQIKFNSADELEVFLRILAEESVLQSRSEIQNIDDDPAQEMFSKRHQADSVKRLKPVSEDIEDEEAPESPAAEVEVSAEEEVETVEEPTSASPMTVSLDTILDTIKQLRSGKSVDDGMIKPQIRAYYDRLDPAERQVLSTFFTAFKDIVTGKSSGADVQDPSDPPLSITITPSEEPKPKEAEASTKDTSSTSSDAEEEEEEGEEVAPPIKVGEPQQIAEIRKRVRLLMKK